MQLAKVKKTRWLEEVMNTIETDNKNNIKLYRYIKGRNTTRYKYK